MYDHLFLLKDNQELIDPVTAIPILSVLEGGQIFANPFSDGAAITALELTNGIITQPWRGTKTWRSAVDSTSNDMATKATLKIATMKASDYSPTLQLRSSDAAFDTSWLPYIIIHVSPKLLEGHANARYTVDISHGGQGPIKISHTFVVAAHALSVSILYLGAVTVDTISVYRGIWFGGKGGATAPTSTEQYPLEVSVDGLPDDSTITVEVPNRDHPLSRYMLNKVLSAIGDRT